MPTLSEKARKARNEYMRNYMREYMRAYREKNGDRRRELDRKNYAENPEKSQKRMNAYWERKASKAEQEG